MGLDLGRHGFAAGDFALPPRVFQGPDCPFIAHIKKALGAILVNFGKTYFTGALPDYWLFALGLLFIVVTLFMPKGIVGLTQQWTNRRKAPKKATDLSAEAAQ